MFFGVFLLIWLAMNAYVFWRAAAIPLIAHHFPRVLLIAVAVFLCALFPVSHSLEDSGLGVIARVLAFAGATWLGVLFLLVVTMLAADIVTGFGWVFRRAAPSIRGWALVAGCLLAVIAVVQGTRAPAVRRYEVQMVGLPAERDGTVVVVASDLHLGALTGARWLSARIGQIRAERPDLVVLAGDILEGHGKSGREFLPALRQLSAALGVWAVNGNHETYSGDAAASPRPTVLEEAGVHVLRDQWAEVRPGLIVAGVEDLTARRRRGYPNAGFVDRALAGRPPGATIFVSHTPWLAERAARQGVALMLSGHTHNGQIWPFTYFVRRTYPMMAGRYEVNGMTLIVCRGTGTWGPRMRLWRPSEIVRVTLRSRQTGNASSAAQAAGGL